MKPTVERRGEPGPGHHALQSLIGRFRVIKTSRFPGVAPHGPVTSSDLIAEREWIGGGRFVREVTRGTMGGQTYFRMGVLGYATLDRRYEWVTVDALNANMMIYQGAPGAGVTHPIEMTGHFTDQGLMGERHVGRSIAQRTEIRIEGPDRAVFRLYVTAPGEAELLADEMDYRRLQPPEGAHA